MGDVADMLGLAIHKPAAPINAAEEVLKLMTAESRSSSALHNNNSNTNGNNKNSSSSAANKTSTATAAAKKPKGMKREVFDLLGKDGIVPAIQSGASALPAFKTKRTIASKGKWIYATIESSARSDNQTTFKHWVKADINYTDYPYAKFNVKLDCVSFTDEEYRVHLKDEQWTKEDSQKLLEVCYQYDLRWPVIFDRISLGLQKSPETIQQRFYQIVNKLYSLREQHISSSGNAEKKLYDYDADKEAKRRLQQDLMYKRTREDEHEELKLREELKSIDTMIKKNRKSNKSSAVASTLAQPLVVEPKIVDPNVPNPSAVTNSGEVGGILLASVTNPLADSAPTPQTGKPCLQSSRLYLTDNSVPVAKSLLQKMNSYLKELNIPERPVATKRVCDLVDQIRKDTVLLISLHNSIKKKEKELFTAKGGNARGQTKNQPKVKQEKTDKGDNPKPEKAKKGSSKKSANVVAVPAELDDSALEALGGDLLPLDGKDEFGDLLDVFDPHDSFHDMESTKPTKAATAKKRARASKIADGGAALEVVEAPPAKKKTKKSAANA